MGGNRVINYFKGGKKNKSLQKKLKNYFIDQKTRVKYKPINDSEIDTFDYNDESPLLSTRNIVVKPEIEIVSKIDNISESPIAQPQPDYDHEESTESPKKISKFKKSKLDFLKSQEDRIADIKAAKTIKRKLKKDRINTAILLNKKTKKGQPLMKNVMKHLLNKLKN